MSKTITVSKLIEKLQNILDEQGDLKVLLSSEEGLGTINPDPLYEGDITVHLDEKVLIIEPSKTVSDIEEVLMPDHLSMRENRSRSYSMEDESEEDINTEEDEDSSFLDDFKDEDVDDWECGEDDE